MSIRSLARRLAWVAALALPLAASAQQAFTTHLLNLRAGPAQDRGGRRRNRAGDQMRPESRRPCMAAFWVTPRGL